MIIWLIIVAIAMCCSAFFAASETSVFSIPREKYDLLKNEKKGNGRKVYEVLTKSNLFLVFLLLGNNFVNIVAILGLGYIFGQIFEQNMTLVFIATTLLLVIFGDILPKTIAVGNYMPIARFVSPIVVIALKIGGGFFKKIDNFNLYILRMNYKYLLQSPDPFVTKDEYSIAIGEAVSNKKLSESAGEIMTSFLDLTQLSVSKISRNRNTLKSIENEESVQLLPNEIGILSESEKIKKVFYRPFDNEKKAIEPTWFPITKTIGDLHNFFLENESDCLLVLDEYGGFYGAVTRYDIYEYWKALCSKKSQKLSEIIVKGNYDVVKYHDWILGETLKKYNDTKTFNGLLCQMSNKIPEVGDKIKDGYFEYKIIEADKTKITKIMIQKLSN